MEKRGESSDRKVGGMHASAVLVGCNYPHKPLEPGGRLFGCDNDVLMMQKTLIRRFGFDPNRIVTMVDEPGSKGKRPTGQNIKKALSEMIGKAKRGDTLFFHFSGHGMCYGERVKTHAIVASDDNIITNVDFRALVNRLPPNATFTIVADTCCSGELIDKEPVQVGLPYHKPDTDDEDADQQTTNITSDNNNHPMMITYESFLGQLSSKTGINDPDIGVHQLQLFGSEASLLFRLPHHQHPKPLKPDEGILLSGSEPHKRTYPDEDENGAPCGAFTKAVVGIVKRHPGPITNRELVNQARGILGKIEPPKYIQYPCLYCSKKNADAFFLGKRSARAEIGETDDETEQA